MIGKSVSNDLLNILEDKGRARSKNLGNPEQVVLGGSVIGKLP